jgi:hypothetical protein
MRVLLTTGYRKVMIGSQFRLNARFFPLGEVFVEATIGRE